MNVSVHLGETRQPLTIFLAFGNYLKRSETKKKLLYQIFIDFKNLVTPKRRVLAQYTNYIGTLVIGNEWHSSDIGSCGWCLLNMWWYLSNRNADVLLNVCKFVFSNKHRRNYNHLEIVMGIVAKEQITKNSNCHVVSLSGLGATCSPRDPRFAG